MKVEKVITLANEHVRIPLLALERSLRNVGCHLPLLVIPFDNRTFSLPPNAQWWELPEITQWISKHQGRPHMRKYQCLIEKNYQFIDTDAIFLKNPEQVLKQHEGFVTSCGHWNNPGETLTEESEALLKRKTTVWQHLVFNTGQFACDRALYPDLRSLQATAENEECINTCLKNPFHEQPGLNLLVHLSGVPITNLTLPPYSMESTWAGDYLDGYEDFWRDSSKMPYLIHWAGTKPQKNTPIGELFFNYLTHKEKEEFLNQQLKIKVSAFESLRIRLRRAIRAFCTPL